MDYQKYAKELICYMVENEQNFKFCNHDVSEIARGEGAVLIYLMDDHDGGECHLKLANVLILIPLG